MKSTEELEAKLADAVALSKQMTDTHFRKTYYEDVEALEDQIEVVSDLLRWMLGESDYDPMPRLAGKLQKMLAREKGEDDE